MRPDTPVQYVKGVGPVRAAAFARLGVATIEDLLYHAPHRYLDATAVTPVARADVGREVTLVGRVVSKGVLPTRRGLRIFRVVLQDESGVIECAWPGQAFLDRVIQPGQLLLVTGPVKHFHGRQITPREHVILADADEPGQDLPTGKGLILPVYPATEGLSHRQIRRIIGEHLEDLAQSIPDALPGAVQRAAKVTSLLHAFRAIHRPPTLAAAEEGRRRLAFDELLDLQLVVTRARLIAKRAPKGATFVIRKDLTSALKQALPFELTRGQKRAIREVTADMVAGERMHRLLMGDVGTGKTVVALFAMLLAVENDHQAALMAPTELLVEQHGRTVTQLLAPLGIVPEILRGRLSSGDKGAVRRRLAQGGARIVIGTHALLEQQTAFQRLGLVVIDEQHRFGVEQRAALMEKGRAPDVLLLSATPIPRTLALTLYGDLDISTLTERPAGRKPVATVVRPGAERERVYQFLRAQCDAGHQAYVVYPVIEESERLDLRAATTMAAELDSRLAPVNVGLVHGRMKADEREAVMRGFRDGAVGVLVATTVVEVGIDVPNATIMVVEHADRFGLAQLHQLRGRVGRGTEASHCILLTDLPGALSRLKQFARLTDGFRIAELDLRERGMGDLVGVRQSGGVILRYANLATDGDLIRHARRIALRMLATDPTLHGAELEPLRKRIERRYERGIELFRVG